MNHHLEGKTALITGGGGAICGEIAKAYYTCGMNIAILDISLEAAEAKAGRIKESDRSGATDGQIIAVQCDVTDLDSVRAAAEETVERFSTIDVLVNGAGGSRKETTTTDEQSFFDLNFKDMEQVMRLNYFSAVLPSQVVGSLFKEKGEGVIINITSVAGFEPLSRSLTYSNGKAAANSFTQWLAVHMAQTYSPNIRVNAIAPGFMLTEQNRFLLIDEKTGESTPRGGRIIEQVPMARYGDPKEIAGAALWLASDASSFVTGAIIPVDGGFTAYCGV